LSGYRVAWKLLLRRYDKTIDDKIISEVKEHCGPAPRFDRHSTLDRHALLRFLMILSKNGSANSSARAAPHPNDFVEKWFCQIFRRASPHPLSRR
jgi:hypothetical protein